MGHLRVAVDLDRFVTAYTDGLDLFPDLATSPVG